jgi:hypothetical protein
MTASISIVEFLGSNRGSGMRQDLTGGGMEKSRNGVMELYGNPATALTSAKVCDDRCCDG